MSTPSPQFDSIIKEAGPNTSDGIKLLWRSLGQLRNSIGVQGPSSTTVGDVALWNNTTGTLLKDVAFSAVNLSDVAATTWTPTDGSGASLSLTINSAQYVKIGKLIVLQGDITYPSTASGATAKISGLPATPVGVNVVGSLYFTAGSAVDHVAFINASGMQVVDTTTGAGMTNSALSTKRFIFTISYITS